MPHPVPTHRSSFLVFTGLHPRNSASTGEAQLRQQEDGDLLVANPNHARNAWRPLKASKKRQGDGLTGSDGDGERQEEEDGSDGDGDSDYDEEDDFSDPYQNENRKVDKFGNYVDDDEEEDEAQQDSVETLEQGAEKLHVG